MEMGYMKILYGNTGGSSHTTWIGWSLQLEEGGAISELDYFFNNNLSNIGNQPDIHVPFYIMNLANHENLKSL